LTPLPAKKAERAFSVLLALLTVASLVPIWCIAYHPLPDLPNHMAAASVLLHARDPNWDFSRYYALNLGVNPYWGYYGLVYVFGLVAGVDVANRIALSLYVIALPLGMLWIARRFGRSDYIALLAFPILWTYSFRMGFINSSLGLALVPAGVGAFDWFCERSTWRRALVAYLVATAILFCHPVPWVLYLALAGVLGLLHRDRSIGRMLRRGTLWIACAATAAAVVLFGQGKGSGLGTLGYNFSWDTHPLTLTAHLFKWSWDNCVGYEDEVLAALLGVSWLALVVTGARRPGREAHGYRAVACAATAFALYVFLPKSAFGPAYSWAIKYRVASWFLLLLLPTIPGEISGWRRWLLVPGLAAGLGFAIDTTVHWHIANRFTAGFERVVDAIPRGSRVLFIFGRPWRRDDVEQDYASGWALYYAAKRGGFNPHLFDDFPIRYKQRFPAPAWQFQSFSFKWEIHAPFYAYVVGFQRDAERLFKEHAGDVTLVVEAGNWKVWKMPGPLIEEPPGPAYPADWSFDPEWRPSSR
jgi:hypothetical protein